jgi:hypothetical protein
MMVEEKIARIIFNTLASWEDIDGDEADWIHYREMLEDAASQIMKKFGVAEPRI